MDFEVAVERLTRPWVDVLTPEESPSGKYEARDREPLLWLLHARIGSSVGTQSSHGGSGHADVLIDAQAFAVEESIRQKTGEASLKLGHMLTGLADPKVLRAGVADLARRADAMHRSSDLADDDWRRIERMIIGWVDEINELFDGWRERDMPGVACPHCQESTRTDPRDHITVSSALIQHYKPGAGLGATFVECLRCGQTWTGTDELVALGGMTGAKIDWDELKRIKAG